MNFSPISGEIPRHFEATGRCSRHYSAVMSSNLLSPRPSSRVAPASVWRPRAVSLGVALLLSCSVHAMTVQPIALSDPGTSLPGDASRADSPLPADVENKLREQLRQLALSTSQQAMPGIDRVEIDVGRLDPRLKLAPCERVEPYLPPGTRLWGRSRIGLRCTLGSTAWNVYLPITVKVYAQGWVAAAPIAAGSVIGPGDLVQSEVDLADNTTALVTDPDQAIGRTVQRAITPGSGIRTADLRARQWFAAGDTVKVVAQGRGFAITGSGEAMAHGVEGRMVRVRTDNGKIVTGFAAGDRRVEIRP
jgi:flagellar basal body P-ring formation protein FlgA